MRTCGQRRLLQRGGYERYWGTVNSRYLGLQLWRRSPPDRSRRHYAGGGSGTAAPSAVRRGYDRNSRNTGAGGSGVKPATVPSYGLQLEYDRPAYAVAADCGPCVLLLCLLHETTLRTDPARHSRLRQLS